MTNSLQKMAIKKVKREILIIITLNLIFYFNPLKIDFSSKNLKTKKNIISEKTWQKIFYQIGVSKSNIGETEISTATPLSVA
jgi:hypothetical protein